MIKILIGSFSLLAGFILLFSHFSYSGPEAVGLMIPHLVFGFFVLARGTREYSLKGQKGDKARKGIIIEIIDIVVIIIFVILMITFFENV